MTDVPISDPSARRTQTERRAVAEARLLAAAREIVARKGWVGMTLAEVGEAAGYSRGLAAHHFGSKPKLLRALASHINDNFMQELDGSPPANDGIDALLSFVSVYLGRTDTRWTNTRALLVLMAEATTDDSETGESLGLYNQSVIEFLATQFRAGIAAGQIRPDVDPMTGAAILLGALRGVMLQSLLKNSRVDLVAVRKELSTMILRSFACEPVKQ
ncbi:TetR/AcrR family transcriptional regulator [soil metagenome]